MNLNGSGGKGDREHWSGHLQFFCDDIDIFFRTIVVIVSSKITNQINHQAVIMFLFTAFLLRRVYYVNIWRLKEENQEMIYFFACNF